MSRTLTLLTVVSFTPGILHDEASAEGVPAFSDQTAAAGIIAAHNPVGTPSFTAGGAVGDFNNDGWQDIYFVVGGGAPDKLYLNNGNGTFTDAAVAWGVALSHRGTGASVGDYDDDGWLDIYVTTLGPTAQPETADKQMLLRNMSGGGFEDRAVEAGVNTLSPPEEGWGAAFGDYDRDGDLDLAVASWDTSNRLFRNDGDGSFTDVTSTAGMSALTNVDGFAPRFADMDGDGWPEMLWVGDFGTSMYFINDGDGTFTDFTAGSGTSQGFTEMGHTVADFNDDGRFDWYVTTISDNKLYINQGSHAYLDRAAVAGVVDTGWGWGTVAIDFDHDGRIDIVATSQSSGQYVFRNETVVPATPNFDDLSGLIGLNSNVSGRGLANLDYDNDGDQDIVIFPRADPLRLFRNDLSGTNTNWLRVFLDTTGHEDLAPGGIDSRVDVVIGGKSRMHRVDGGSNYLSQSEMSAHFGLGSTAVVDAVEVHWTNGTMTVLENVAANQTLILTPGSSTGCAGVADCADTNDDGLRDDPCVWWACAAGSCLGTDIGFSDIGGANGACPPDGATDANDRFHALNCFSDQNTLGLAGYECESSSPQALNVDAGGPFGDCNPDGVCDANDAFHSLNVFSGISTCSCPSGPAPGGPSSTRKPPAPIEQARLDLLADADILRAGDRFSVRVQVRDDVQDLRGYQLHVGTAGGRQGRIELVDIVFDGPAPRALDRVTTWSAFNVATAQLAVGTDGPGAALRGGSQLATFVFRASADARGRFRVELLHDATDPGHRTFLFATPAGGRIAVTDSRAAVVRVIPGKAGRRAESDPR